MELSGKHVLITGGSSGIGKATAQVCCARGARVVICARREDALRSTVDELREQFPDHVDYIVCDVSDEASVRKAVHTAQERLGVLNAVIHAAAVLGPIGPISENSSVEWEDTIRINLLGTFFVTKEACRSMQKTGGGRIVLFSGGGGGSAFPNYTAYACSKAAIVRLTETVAIEMAAHSIEINCVAPGMVATPMHEATLRAGSAAGDAYLQKTRAMLDGGGVSALVGATAAAFLISEAAKGITGRFVAAPYDRYEQWSEHLHEIQDSELFQLRRVVPRDRGGDWQ